MVAINPYILVNPTVDLATSRSRSPPVDFSAIPSPPTLQSPTTSPQHTLLPLTIDDDVLFIPPHRRPYQSHRSSGTVPQSTRPPPSILQPTQLLSQRRPRSPSPESNQTITIIEIHDSDDSSEVTTVQPSRQQRRRIQPRQPTDEEMVERLEISMRDSRIRHQQYQQERESLDSDEQAVNESEQALIVEHEALLHRLQQIEQERAQLRQQIVHFSNRRDQLDHLDNEERIYFDGIMQQVRGHLPTEQVPRFDDAMARDIDGYLEESRRQRRANHTPRTWRDGTRNTLHM
ncbi:hypothetical protein DM01DRAFT_1331745 [Hesseltinella vesiculosa]|uniref:Uncharacterized protein n=1 Tax=Hesseltinella vesiculosa TaxID=101127 RepID=A0A1X2GW76_9FUNG|nr:hypothetical protein DM01DRAFT_1331745 [Hesseltinella vesiculosa]